MVKSFLLILNSKSISPRHSAWGKTKFQTYSICRGQNDLARTLHSSKKQPILEGGEANIWLCICRHGVWGGLLLWIYAIFQNSLSVDILVSSVRDVICSQWEIVSRIALPLHFDALRGPCCLRGGVRSHHEKHMLADTNRKHRQMREWLLVVISCHLIFKSLSLNTSLGKKSSPVTSHRKRLRLKTLSLFFLS